MRMARQGRGTATWRPGRAVLILALVAWSSGLGGEPVWSQAVAPVADHLARSGSPAPDRGQMGDRVSILNATRQGLVETLVTGDGETRVRVALTNKTPRRLAIVLPPGLVAVAATGQQQNMGLGGFGLPEGAFGRDRPDDDPGDVIDLPAGRTLKIALPGVCLDYGKPTPTPSHRFVLETIESASGDVRLAAVMGRLARTSCARGVAQAAAWHLRNHLSWSQLVKLGRKEINPHEVALAARLVELTDLALSREQRPATPDELKRERLMVTVQGYGTHTSSAEALSQAITHGGLLGLPATLIAASERPLAPHHTALWIKAAWPDTHPHDQPLTLKVEVFAVQPGLGTGWRSLGSTTASLTTPGDAEAARTAVETALARGFVSIKKMAQQRDHTRYRIENRLPFSIAELTVAEESIPGAFPHVLEPLGVGPKRFTVVPIAAEANLTPERIRLSGL